MTNILKLIEPRQVCHCCNQSVDNPRVLIDEGGRLINYKGVSAELTGKEFTIVIFLLKRPNYVFLKEIIYDHLYNLLPFCDWPEIKVIDTLICKIRKKLKNTGLVVKSHWGNGYSICVEPMFDIENNTKQKAA